MESNAQINPSNLDSAFTAYERGVRVKNYKVACFLAFIFMPAGISLDYFVYRDKVGQFLAFRLLCSLLLAGIWLVLHFRPKTWAYRLLGMLVAVLPLIFISVMIYLTEGAASPYYAGLNLVMLGAAILLRWTLMDSVIVFALSLAAYLAACLIPGPHDSFPKTGIFFSNFYFLFVTGVFILTGSWFYNQIRFSEFALRFELDQNRKKLEEGNQKLKELDQVKSRFFANISHELRTPLTLLLAPLETLLHQFNLDSDVRNLLGTMHSNGMRLLKLINDLLDLVRLESGRMEIKKEPIEIAEFFKGITGSTRQMADRKRLRLDSHADPALGMVLADRDKLEKILLNLVFNAMKFTPVGGRVDIRGERQGDKMLLTVSDTGVGISAAHLPYVFDRFWQADGSSKRKFQGVGIGLALVKELVDIQGGSVSVESVEGAGATFKILLPYEKVELQAHTPIALANGEKTETNGDGGSVTSEEWLANLYRRAELFPAQTPVAEAEPASPQHSRNGHLPLLLIADDEPDMLAFLKSQLKTQYRVIEASDGAQAVDKASQFLPDIILLDMMMPEKDGLQACREIREHTPTQSIPVILLTARADEETKLAALSAGASDFLAKPFSSTELHVRIKNLVESHQYQRKLSKQNQVLESTIEQLKDTETQLVQTEKLASLGRMSAGIIHEINNPLNFATTGLFTLRKKGQHLAAEQQSEYQEILQDVEDGIKRVRTIVSDLRMFTHPDTESRDQVEVSEVVTSALRFMSNELRDVKVETSLPEHHCVWANKNKLIHVLVNLLQNSTDALRKKVFENEKPSIWIEGRVEPGKSILAVRDNGSGIDSKNLSKIFDPFFTTKDVGEGMGLGLAICYRIVHECDGKIVVRTEAGKYSEFALEFPAKG
jgi:signal transduction histidine kinase